jgi:alcohol dehydrogenase
VILDPELLATVPAPVAATAGMDALSHALESFVTSARTAASATLSGRAFELLESSVEAMARPPASAADRGRALLGSYLAGAAIEESMLGAAHAAANPLTARHGVIHGEAIGLMLPSVIRFNSEVADTLYSELWPSGGEGLASRVEEIRGRLDLPSSLGEKDIDEGEIPRLAALACGEWTGGFNPRPVDRAGFEEIYAGAL